MPSTSIQRRFLRPALSWLITAEPAMSLAVRNMIKALSSVCTSTSGASLSTALIVAAVDAGRRLIVIEVVATSRATRSPEPHPMGPHKWGPLSPRAGDGPPALESTRQLVALG